MDDLDLAISCVVHADPYSMTVLRWRRTILAMDRRFKKRA